MIGLLAVTRAGRWRQMDSLLEEKIMRLHWEESWVKTQGSQHLRQKKQEPAPESR